MFNGDDEIKMRIENRDDKIKMWIENRDEDIVYFLRNYCDNVIKFDEKITTLNRLRNFIQYDYSINLRELIRSRIASSFALY